jgi:hypothetical protein
MSRLLLEEMILFLIHDLYRVSPKMHNNGQHCWVSCIYYILKELDMLKMFKSPLTCSAREINIIRKKIRDIQKFGGRTLI